MNFVKIYNPKEDDNPYILSDGIISLFENKFKKSYSLNYEEKKILIEERKIGFKYDKFLRYIFSGDIKQFIASFENPSILIEKLKEKGILDLISNQDQDIGDYIKTDEFSNLIYDFLLNFISWAEEIYFNKHIKNLEIFRSIIIAGEIISKVSYISFLKSISENKKITTLEDIKSELIENLNILTFFVKRFISCLLNVKNDKRIDINKTLTFLSDVYNILDLTYNEILMQL